MQWYYEQILSEKKREFKCPHHRPLTSYGTGWGAHTCCLIEDSCTFLSYGISIDYSFDVDLAQKHGCKGYLFDPTVTYNKHISPPLPLEFYKIGAPMLDEASPFPVMSPYDWAIQNQVSFNILKMDCEGCEYALYSDNLKTNFTMLDTLEQFVIEVHLGQGFMKSDKHFWAYAGLLRVLFEHDFQIVDSELGGCSWLDARLGCNEKMTKYGCVGGKRADNVSMNVEGGNTCQNILFSKVYSRTLGMKA